MQESVQQTNLIYSRHYGSNIYPQRVHVLTLDITRVSASVHVFSLTFQLQCKNCNYLKFASFKIHSNRSSKALSIFLYTQLRLSFCFYGGNLASFSDTIQALSCNIKVYVSNFEQSQANQQSSNRITHYAVYGESSDQATFLKSAQKNIKKATCPQEINQIPGWCFKFIITVTLFVLLDLYSQDSLIKMAVYRQKRYRCLGSGPSCGSNRLGVFVENLRDDLTEAQEHSQSMILEVRKWFNIQK